jgi:Fe-S-cluster formation regulator IscX/YfhJ
MPQLANSHSLLMVRRAITPPLVLATLSLLGCSGSRGGAPTPEAAFETFKASQAKGDYRTAFSQMTPDCLEISLGNSVIWVALMKDWLDPSKVAEVEKIFNKYDVKTVDPKKLNFTHLQDTIKASVGDVKDKTACIAEVLTWIDKNCPPQNRQEGLEQFAGATLVGVRIEGDRASGAMRYIEAQYEKMIPVRFERIGGRWFMDLTDASVPASPASK